MDNGSLSDLFEYDRRRKRIVNPAGEIIAEAAGDFKLAVSEIDLNREWANQMALHRARVGEGKSLLSRNADRTRILVFSQLPKNDLRRYEERMLNKYSSRITQPKSQGASQAMLYATGLSEEEDMKKPQVGIASVWYEGNPCNMHLIDLAAKVKEGRRGRRAWSGMRFNTIGVSDGISMGTDGMSYSLQSRDLIADSIETVMGAQWYDANISIPGCDKNMPGCLMAMGRLNRPSLMVYGGTIRAGHRRQDEKLDVVSAFQCYGEFIAGDIDEAAAAGRSCARLSRRRRLRRHVHGQHDGVGDRGAGHVAAVQLVDAGRGSAEAGGMHRRGRRDPDAAGDWISSRATS